MKPSFELTTKAQSSHNESQRRDTRVTNPEPEFTGRFATRHCHLFRIPLCPFVRPLCLCGEIL
ncbi:hypothetical protein FTUN_3087 [Frigoriglobus tundricola]|uniref:Uncharacterized protein n=1 Tax=Frigoriglobus tundricola TaxID=2774151 RepID=A0A6M5YNL2_9BACT|nr:hypothetical protein FTUN_3087 [Frigoriglobus tundricola]